jgi:hypothetical protein
MEVELDGRDEPIKVVVDGRDIRRWEAANEKSFITEPISYTSLTELAGHAAIRQGLYDGKHKDFMDDAVNVVQVGDEDDSEVPAGPTKRGRGAASSRR